MVACLQIETSHYLPSHSFTIIYYEMSFIVDDSSFYFIFFLILYSLSNSVVYFVLCRVFTPPQKYTLHRYCVCRFFFGFPPLYCRSRFGRLNSIVHTTGNKQSTLIPPATRSLKKTSLLFRRHLTSLFPSHFKFNSFTEPVLEDTLFFCFVSL